MFLRSAILLVLILVPLSTEAAFGGSLSIGSGSDPYGYCKTQGLDLVGYPGACGSSSSRRSSRSSSRSSRRSSSRRDQSAITRKEGSKKEPCEPVPEKRSPVVRGDYSSYLARLLSER